MENKASYRIEKDAIGEKQVPVDAYYGVQSLRAYENFKISGTKVHPEMVTGIAQIKQAAAIANKNAGALDAKIADAIVAACKEILEGKLRDQFIVDAIQGGAGTSFNMNANEVIANRAIEILGGTKGDYSVVHPNDHVNCGQSTNDAYPSSGKIALVKMLQNAIPALEGLRDAFGKKAKEFKNVIKMGRTEMQDAVPMTLGQAFNAFAAAVERDIRRFRYAIEEMSVLNMGATAIGTGINADPKYIETIVDVVSEVTGMPFTQSEDLIDGTQNLDGFVYVSGILKSCAVTISKIANDLRLMSSGPRTGLAEINLPPKQNGSSIMPGKINPVIPEVVSQIAFNVMGHDTTVALAAESGQQELNAFEPIIFRCLFESVETLTNGINIFVKECIEGITANADVCREDVESCLGLATALCNHIGYEKSSNLAKQALREGKKLKEVALENKIMSEEELDDVLDPFKMI